VTAGTDVTAVEGNTVTLSGVDYAGLTLAAGADNTADLYEDGAPYLVSAVYSDNGALGVDAGDTLTLTFNEPMDTTQNTVVQVDGTDFLVNAVAGTSALFSDGSNDETYSWNADGDVLTVTLGSNPGLAHGDYLALAAAGDIDDAPANNNGDETVAVQVLMATDAYQVSALVKSDYYLDAPNTEGYAIFGLNLRQPTAGAGHMLSSVQVSLTGGSGSAALADYSFALYQDTNSDGAYDYGTRPAG
jgi:hypothetical protein